MYYVYVLKSTLFNKSYVGKTTDLNRRIFEHNNGKSHYTKRYKPWVLIYKESYFTEENAIIREKYLKSHSGRRELKKIFDKYCPVG